MSQIRKEKLAKKQHNLKELENFTWNCHIKQEHKQTKNFISTNQE